LALYLSLWLHNQLQARPNTAALKVRTINPAIQIIPAIEIPDILIITVTMTEAGSTTGESVVTEMITADTEKEAGKEEEEEESIIITIITIPRDPMEGEQTKEIQETQDNFGNALSNLKAAVK
jgi:hypothetical protein